MSENSAAVEAAIQEIESIQFEARLAIANNIATLIALLRQQSSLQLLFKCSSDEKVLALVTDRAKTLLAQRFDPSYRNSADAALAAYLMVLDNAGKVHSLGLTASFVRRSDLWWARRLASHLQPRLSFKLSSPIGQNKQLQNKQIQAGVFRVTLSDAVYNEASRRGYHCRTEWVEKAIDFVDFAIDHFGQNPQPTKVREVQFSGESLIGSGR